jgi:hypothetical protein
MVFSYYWCGVISGIAFFALLFVSTLIPKIISIFAKKHGRRHRLVGMIYLFWLLVGFYGSVYYFSWWSYLLYDVLLACLGIVLTLTAASDFSYHKYAKNIASGTLDNKATVTYDEMIEHSFYQGLNLVHIIFLHMLSYPYWGRYNLPAYKPWINLVLLLACTSPWLIRSRFPINKFSDNYLKAETHTRVSLIIRILYRLKKYQYLLYKHWLLHGLNISIAMLSLTADSLSTSLAFRLYWILLNTAYTMEFFLQTLVKKHFMTQVFMLFLQQVLMLASTSAALPIVLYQVNHLVALTSLLLNLLHRKHEVMNVSALILLVAIYKRCVGI